MICPICAGLRMMGIVVCWYCDGSGVAPALSSPPKEPKEEEA